MTGLVVGIGNDLRGDDAVGHVVARAVAARVPDVDVLVVHQVLPELAETLCRYRTVVFVDATLDDATLPDAGTLDVGTLDVGTLDVGTTAVQELPVATGAGRASHVGSPAAAVGLVAVLGGTPPRAWLVTVPVTDVGLGEGLSPQAAALVGEAVDVVTRLVGA